MAASEDGMEYVPAVGKLLLAFIVLPSEGSVVDMAP
jgi:hypothetical protein